MKNPFFNLIAAVWHYGAPWRKAIVGYYAAYICAQAAYSLSPYALGRTIDVLQNFTPGRMHGLNLSVGQKQRLACSSTANWLLKVRPVNY